MFNPKCQTLNVDIMCETLHPLNDLYAKCCKHWLFWGNFRSLFSHIGRFLSHNLTNVGFQVLKIWRFICINTVFRLAPLKMSNGVKSHDLGGQLISPRRKIMRPGNVSCNKAIFSRIVWHVAPFCWSHTFSKSYSSIASKKSRLSYDHNAPIVIFEEERSNHTFWPNWMFFWM